MRVKVFVIKMLLEGKTDGQNLGDMLLDIFHGRIKASLGVHEVTLWLLISPATWLSVHELVQANKEKCHSSA